MIAYASRTYCMAEVNYCTTRQELLAVVHFVKQFKQYFLGRELVIRTDHAALTWLQRTPDIIGQQARRQERLQEFNFKIQHRPGTRHCNADALSRRPSRRPRCSLPQVEPKDSARAVEASRSNVEKSDGAMSSSIPEVDSAPVASTLPLLVVAAAIEPDPNG